jgi:hypothetical protein
MRLGCGADVRVHLACASVRKHFLREARQGCRDFSCKKAHHSLEVTVVLVRFDSIPFLRISESFSRNLEPDSAH